MKAPNSISGLRSSLLDWYDRNARDLPWRHTKDPYAIWVSEIMLQQTRVAAVIERYNAFMARFPTVVALGEASEQEVLAQWSGLGYYRRARMLHKAAKCVAVELRSEVPRTSAELRGLPGIGSYTAAAIASIAHGECVAVVDGNVERVLSRLQGWGSAGSSEAAALRREVGALSAKLVDPGRPGDFNQAIMDLGATVCTPRSPQCLVCPWTAECKTRGEHKTRRRAPMTTKEMTCALCLRGVGEEAGSEVLLEQRPATNTVMSEMWELPILHEADVPSHELRLTVRHAIMQVNYIVRVRSLNEAEIQRRAEETGRRRWVSPDEADGMALTGLARKVLSRVGLLQGDNPNRVVRSAPPAIVDVA